LCTGKSSHSSRSFPPLQLFFIFVMANGRYCQRRAVILLAMLAIAESRRVQQYVGLMNDPGPPLDLFSLAEVNRSSSEVSFVPLRLSGPKPVAVASRSAVSQGPRSHIHMKEPQPASGVGTPSWRRLVAPWRHRRVPLAPPRGRQSHSGSASDTSIQPLTSAKGIRSMTPSLVNALPGRAKGAVMSVHEKNKGVERRGRRIGGVVPSLRTRAPDGNSFAQDSRRKAETSPTPEGLEEESLLGDLTFTTASVILVGLLVANIFALRDGPANTFSYSMSSYSQTMVISDDDTGKPKLETRSKASFSTNVPGLAEQMAERRNTGDAVPLPKTDFYSIFPSEF